MILASLADCTSREASREVPVYLYDLTYLPAQSLQDTTTI